MHHNMMNTLKAFGEDFLPVSVNLYKLALMARFGFLNIMIPFFSAIQSKPQPELFLLFQLW